MTDADRVTPCDLMITGARVIDPETGLDAVRAVGITGGTIGAVSETPLLPARATWDMAGSVLAPGFIDLHSHAQTIMGLRLQALDGITTALELESGVLPVAASYAEAEAEGRPVNFGFSASWVGARMQVLDGVRLDPDGRGGLAASALIRDCHDGVGRAATRRSPRS